MIKNSKRLVLAATLATALLSAPVIAQEFSGPRKKIKDT